MKETLLTLLDIVLSWIGLTRTVHYESVCDLWREDVFAYSHRCAIYSSYLRELRDVTPHDNIKEEINAVLKQATTSVHTDMPD